MMYALASFSRKCCHACVKHGSNDSLNVGYRYCTYQHGHRTIQMHICMQLRRLEKSVACIIINMFPKTTPHPFLIQPYHFAVITIMLKALQEHSGITCTCACIYVYMHMKMKGLSMLAAIHADQSKIIISMFFLL